MAGTSGHFRDIRQLNKGFTEAIRALQDSGGMNLCFIRQFDNLLKGFAIADSQTFIEGRPYQLFMVVGEKVVGLVMIAIKEGGLAKM